MNNLIFASAFILALGFSHVAQANTLTLCIRTNSSDGNIRAAIYADAAAFDRGTILTGKTLPAVSGTTKLTFSGLEPGSYGIALFQDLNGNEKLDRNLLGAPIEPFGFSNNPVIGFAAPTFEEFVVDFDGSPTTLNIILNGG